MASYDYDLFVIGGGSGGVRAGRIAAGHGAKVGLAEEYRLGGTCVIRGCIPKKLFVYASRFGEEFEDAAGYGWTVGKSRFDWPTLVDNKDREIERLSRAYASTLERAGVEIIHSRAELEHPHRIRLPGEDRTVTARTILIATGGTPFMTLDIPGIEHAVTSNEMFHLETLPRRLVINGGGYIAVEFACIMRGLGVETTLIYRGEEILRGFDDDCRRMLREAMEHRGIEVRCGQEISAISKTRGGFTVRTTAGRPIATDLVMFAVGRRPNTAGLGLDHAGVAINDAGAVVVDAHSRSSVDNIYAVGDVTDRLNLTPVAVREGHAFADSVFGGRKVKVDHENVPKAVFSHPEIGSVGLTEAEACERHAAVDVYRSVFRPLRHTLSGRDERMMVKLLVDGDSGRVLGCHIVGVDAAEMVQLVAVAIKMKATKADFDATMALHPTAAEELVTLREPVTRHRRKGDAKPKPKGKARPKSEARVAGD